MIPSEINALAQAIYAFSNVQTSVPWDALTDGAQHEYIRMAYRLNTEIEKLGWALGQDGEKS